MDPSSDTPAPRSAAGSTRAFVLFVIFVVRLFSSG
jgi:hypothetical protein